MDLYPNDRKRLEEILPGRVSFQHAERALASHDVSKPPGIVKLMLKTLPDAVVWPETPDELAALAAWARERKVALVPRGGATAGYGGAMPVMGGVVVDMGRISRHLEVDAEARTATIDAGMTFLEAERRLNHEGLGLRTYPTSAPAATVGGWVAQGGAGVGALRYGSVREDLVSVDIVLPTGEKRTFSGSELDVVEGLEGTTGFIVRVTVKVRENKPLAPQLVTFPDLTKFHEGMNALARLPLYNITFHNPEFANLRQEVTGKRNVPADQWSALVVMEAHETEALLPKVKQAVEAAGGKVQDEKKAADEWASRFRVFAAKRLGPSMIPGEAVVPLERLGNALLRIRDRVKAPDYSIEGIVTKGGDCILFAFALDDERRPQYNGAFGPAIVLLAEGKRAGGGAFGTGVYLSGEAPRVLGARYGRAKAFKRTVDPAGVMNPGKVFGTPIRPLTALLGEKAPLPTLHQALKPGEPLLAATQGLVLFKRPTGHRVPSGMALAKAIGSADAGQWGTTYAWEALACVECNYCQTVCPAYQAERRASYGPAGHVFWAKDRARGRGTFTPFMVDQLAACSDCGACDAICQVDIPISSMMRELRAQLYDEGHEVLGPVAQAAANIARTGNLYGKPNQDRAGWASGLPDKGEVLLWADDEAAFGRPQAAKAALELLQAAGAKVASLGAEERSSCDGAISAGLLADVRAVVAKNVELIGKSGAKTVVVLDPHAARVLPGIYKQVAEEDGKPFAAHFQWIGTWLAANAAKLSLPKAEVAAMWAGSATAGHLAGPNVEHFVLQAAGGGASNWRGDDWGPDLNTGGLAHLAHPEVSTKQARQRLEEASAAGVQVLVAASPSDAKVLEAAAGDFEAAPEIVTVPEFFATLKAGGFGAPVRTALAGEEATSGTLQGGKREPEEAASAAGS